MMGSPKSSAITSVIWPVFFFNLCFATHGVLVYAPCDLTHLGIGIAVVEPSFTMYSVLVAGNVPPNQSTVTNTGFFGSV
jgi:hypothetical protein